MPEPNEVYDAATESWVTVEESTTWTPVEGESWSDNTEPEQHTNTSEPTNEEVITTTSCDELGKRHKYKDRQTGIVHDYCLNCGRPKPVPGAGTQRQSSGGTRKSSKTAPLDMLLSGAWMGLGYVAGNVLPKPAGPAVSKTLRLEAAIAGPRLHKALKKTPIYPYIALASDQFSWAADIAMLLTPPLLVGLIAMKPELKIPLRGMLAATLVPVIAESIAAAKTQAALMAELEKYDEETVNAAVKAVDYLLGDEDDESEAA